MYVIMTFIQDTGLEKEVLIIKGPEVLQLIHLQCMHSIRLSKDGKKRTRFSKDWKKRI